MTRATRSPKLLPWFVSDVTPPDFKSAISSLLSPAFFPSESEAQTTAHEQSEGAIPTPSELPESRVHLKEMVTRWAGYLENGVFALSVPIDTPLGASEIKVSVCRVHMMRLKHQHRVLGKLLDVTVSVLEHGGARP